MDCTIKYLKINKISYAEKSIKSSNKDNKKNRKDANSQTNKRTWLKNVDYKNGGLLSDNKMKLKKKKNNNKNEQENDDDDSSSKKPKKKAKFLSKSHREQHDNIFSKKFKQNKLKQNKK